MAKNEEKNPPAVREGGGQPAQPVKQGSETGQSKAESSSGPRSKADREQKSQQSTETRKEQKSESSGVADVVSTAAKVGFGLKIMGFVQHIAGMLKTVLGLIKMLSTIQAIALAAVGILVAVAATVFGFLFGIDDTEVARRDYNPDDCVVYVSKGAIGDGTNSVDADILRMRTSRQIYHVLYTYGLRPEQCFAVLGNWAHESGLDPTAVETVFDEPYRIGEDKQDALHFDFLMQKWKPDYAAQYPKIKRAGIGLGQWTDLDSNSNFNKGRNTKLREYAQFAGHGVLNSEYHGRLDDAFQWYDLAVQLAFAIDTSDVGDSGAAWLKEWSEIGEEEFKGDKGSYNKYYTEVFPIVGPEDEHEEDAYYDDEDRETSRVTADEEADAAEAEGAFDVWVQDGVDPDTGPYGHYEVDQSAYNEFWKRVYKKTLYWETTKRYTADFLANWEGVAGNALDSRINKAEKYFDMWWEASVVEEPNFDAESQDIPVAGAGKFFKIEEGYANSVLKVLDVTKDLDVIKTKAYHTDGDINTCRRYTFSIVKSIGQCAAMLAWPTRGESEGNPGTELFQHVHDLVLPGDGVYMSCDRTVATAVRWSGFDDDYPAGPTLTQMQYLVTSPRWTELDWGGDVNQLQAGDVLIKKDSMEMGSDNEDDPSDTHHTLIYVGEWYAKIYGSKNGSSDFNDVAEGSCIVEGSYGERSPGVGTWSASFENYHAFRCTNPMDQNKSKYMGIGYVEAAH